MSASRRVLVRTALLLALLVSTAPSLSWSAGAARVTQVRHDLQSILDAAMPGAVVELGAETFAGPIRISNPVTLRGQGSVIDGRGSGTPLVIAAPGVRVEGLVVRRSGDDIGAPDACIFVEASASGAVVRDSTLEECAFGIWIHETDGVEVIDNRISGRKGVRSADRGNGIHLFDGSHLTVRGNHVTDVRDGIYVSATEDSLIERNTAEKVRFGIHYMYSYRNTLLDNITDHNTVGIALMESRDLVVVGNRAAHNTRNGLLFRDVLDSEIRENELLENGNGMFFFSSTGNAILDNVVRDNEIGLKIWAGTRRNRVEGNVLWGNREQVLYVGSHDQVWGEDGRGNTWGDYVGWDQDGDGIGDRPHRVDSFTASLLYRHPAAVLLLRSPALEMLAHLADRLPMLRTATVIDRSPLVGSTPTAGGD